MLYTELTRQAMIEGTEKDSNSLPIGSVPNGLFLCTIVLSLILI